MGEISLGGCPEVQMKADFGRFPALRCPLASKAEDARGERDGAVSEASQKAERQGGGRGGGLCTPH